MDARKIEAKEVVPASRKLSRVDARELARGAAKIIVSKGPTVTRFAGGEAAHEAVNAMLGPTGNLRAPTLRVGKTLLVGFNEEVYLDILG